MKHSLFLKFFCISAVALSAVALSAMDPIIIRASKNGATDWGTAEKTFKEGKKNVVYPLKKLTPAQLAEVASMPDMNRLTLAAQKAAEEEYHYTLESATAQWEKESKKNNAIVSSAGPAKKLQTFEPGESSFYVTATAESISFLFKNSTLHQGKYEIFLEPMESGRFGHQGIHYIFDQGAGDWCENVGWSYCGSGKIRTEGSMTLDSEALTRLTIPMSAFIGVIGEIPVCSSRSALWRVSVFRWDGDNSSSLCGVPHEDVPAYLVLPVFSRKEEMNVKGGFINSTITAYYHLDQKTNKSPYEMYFDERMGEAQNIHFWLKRMDVKLRLGYPFLFTECYIASMPRRVPKEVVGDKEKTKELDYRWKEWYDDQETIGGFLKKESNNAAIMDEMLRLYMQPFYNLQFGYELLQIESARHRAFTDLLLQENFFEPKLGSEPYHMGLKK